MILYTLTLSFLPFSVFVDLISKQREMNVNLPNVNIANTAGAICTPNLVKDIQKHLNVRNVRSIYGLTETTAAVFQSLPDDGNETLQNSVGYISDHTEAKVIDENGKVVPFGQAGELCVRGYMTLMDYFDDAAKTKEVLSADGWFKTGDQFVLYENGYANIVGRLKEMIIRGGENLYPREIEDFLNTHPNVEETHVVGTYGNFGNVN
jgi:medium-chain acyl-CoA ligase, mitochondrial